MGWKTVISASTALPQVYSCFSNSVREKHTLLGTMTLFNKKALKKIEFVFIMGNCVGHTLEQSFIL